MQSLDYVVVQSATGVGGMLSGVQTDMLASIGEALPYAGAIFAAIAGIMVGVKLFKRITGARS